MKVHPPLTDTVFNHADRRSLRVHCPTKENTTILKSNLKRLAAREVPEQRSGFPWSCGSEKFGRAGLPLEMDTMQFTGQDVEHFMNIIKTISIQD
jgi:hypothetical protein